MKRRIHLMLVLGTRPDAIKMAPLIRLLRGRTDVSVSVVSTGQHPDLLPPIFRWFECEPDHDLRVMVAGQSLSQLTGRTLTDLDAVMSSGHPDCILAVGDTASTMAAGLAAFYRRLPFVHVEAGLRTGRLEAPWPEELNRRVAALTATLHCAPTPRAVDNLLREGVPAPQIHCTGNPIVDALAWTREKLRRAPVLLSLPRELGDVAERPLVLITCHRRENLGPPLGNVLRAVEELATAWLDCVFILPLHVNPAVHAQILTSLAAQTNVRIVAPLDYATCIWLMERAALVLSDSGGMQEEIPSLGTPLLVLRDATERPEVLECGYARLIGTETRRIVEESRIVLRGGWTGPTASQTSPFGDGQAAGRIADCVRAIFD